MLKTLSVSELSFYISNIFDAEELLHNIKVYGEVSNLSFVRGNLYFTLKDENSLLPCIMFGASSGNVKEGDQVLITGTVKYYSKGGRLNLYVTSLTPYGSGLLYQKFLELKNKLELEGVFSENYKKPLPKSIRTIGVVTSETGAVLHDIQTVSHRRNPSLDIIVYPAKVQGDGAENTIIKALKYLDRLENIDVIIIARGGGSIEDLQPFNTEILARAIIKCSKPVISAVGHETDFTICDFASSIRAATPSVAAEIVTNNIFDEYEKTKSIMQKISMLLFHKYDSLYERLDFFSKKINFQIKNVLERKAFDFAIQKRKLGMLSNNFIISKEHNLNIIENKLTLLNPVNILKSGWAKIIKKNKTIKSINDISNNDEIKIEMLDGTAEAKITSINN